MRATTTYIIIGFNAPGQHFATDGDTILAVRFDPESAQDAARERKEYDGYRLEEWTEKGQVA